MKKIKIIGAFLIVMFLMNAFSSVKAVELQNDNITIEKTITNYVDWKSEEGGEINFKISNLKLDKEAKYKYKINNETKETAYYDVKSIDAEEGIITIEITKSKNDILEILKISDDAYLTIQETDAENTVKNIVENKKIDISLSLSKAYKVGHFGSGYHGIYHTYDIEEIYYKYEKVQDEEILKKYIEYLKGYDSNQETIYWGYYVDNLIDEMNIENNMPTSGWKKLQSNQTDTQPSEEGLYFVWIKAPKTEKNKELLGCVFSKRFSDIKVIEEQLKDVQNKKEEQKDNETEKPDTETENKENKEKEDNEENKEDKEDKETEDTNTKEEQEDDTIATGKLPQTGASITLGICIIIVSIVTIMILVKYRSYEKI